jgi:hypothetical protein
MMLHAVDDMNKLYQKSLCSPTQSLACTSHLALYVAASASAAASLLASASDRPSMLSSAAASMLKCLSAMAAVPWHPSAAARAVMLQVLQVLWYRGAGLHLLLL